MPSHCCSLHQTITQDKFHMKLRYLMILFSCQKKKIMCRKLGMRDMGVIEMVSQNGQCVELFENVRDTLSCIVQKMRIDVRDFMLL
jgi:hypothetical protein